MSSSLEAVQLHSAEGQTEPSRFRQLLDRISTGFMPGVEYPTPNITNLESVITTETPVLSVSLEFYSKKKHNIKAHGGLGVLEGDNQDVSEDLQVPTVHLTPYYTEESHQKLDSNFWQTERTVELDPAQDERYRLLGRAAISTAEDSSVILDFYERIDQEFARVITPSEPKLGELYPGGNSSNHRLYQQVSLGFGGDKFLKKHGIRPSFIQLNEAPTVFTAIARLDEICEANPDLSINEAIELNSRQILFTNHTLVPAVEGEFTRDQFDHFVFPNIKNDSVKEWVGGMLDEDRGDAVHGKVKLSALAIELAGPKSGVSDIHAHVSDFKYRDGETQVAFESVVNGIASRWITPEIKDYYQELGVLDEFDIPTVDFKENLDELDPERIMELKALGREHMNEVLGRREDQYGNPVTIPQDAMVFNWMRRIADYKRPGMMFNDPDRLAQILEDKDAHVIFSGKPHPTDIPMKKELQRLLYLIDSNPVLKERVHYIQDYDEEIGEALAKGSDCAVNNPVVGKEACGTSWMKNLANFGLLATTIDGGVAIYEKNEAGEIVNEQPTTSCLEISGNETEALYACMETAADITRDSSRLKAAIAKQLKDYMPVISGGRMRAQYLNLYNRLLQEAASLEFVDAVAA